jgi:hypothetical protein
VRPLIGCVRGKPQRWAVERTNNWHDRFRALLTRWERKANHHLALVYLVTTADGVRCQMSIRAEHVEQGAPKRIARTCDRRFDRDPRVWARIPYPVARRRLRQLVYEHRSGTEVRMVDGQSISQQMMPGGRPAHGAPPWPPSAAHSARVVQISSHNTPRGATLSSFGALVSAELVASSTEAGAGEATGPGSTAQLAIPKQRTAITTRFITSSSHAQRGCCVRGRYTKSRGSAHDGGVVISTRDSWPWCAVHSWLAISAP